jgi:superfamily II DNA or RNA helicase
MPTSSLRFDQGTLVLAGWTRPAIEAVFVDHNPWVWDSRSLVWRCDALHYPRLKPQLEARAWGVVDEAADWPLTRLGKIQLPAPHPEQQQAIERWLTAGSGVVIMPTGTGKTEVALHLMARLSVSTLIVAPVRDLMYQWHRRILRGLNYDAGVIGDNTFDIRPVSVTTYDSATIHAPVLGNRFQMIVFDECHHLPGELRRDAARMSLATRRLGLTATPERADGREVDLEWLIGPPVYELPLSAVRGSVLADYEVVRIPVRLNNDEQSDYDRLSGIVREYVRERRKTEARFTWQSLCAETAEDTEARAALTAWRQKQAIEDRASEKFRVLEDLFRLHARTPVLVFAGSNAMAIAISRRFLIPCLLNHCGKRERLQILEGFQSGVYPALVANQVLDEGVDLPETKVAIVVGGTSSTRQARQRLGRVLRKSGNACAVLYEVVCNETSESGRSRRRRKNDAYQRTRHRRL